MSPRSADPRVAITRVRALAALTAAYFGLSLLSHDLGLIGGDVAPLWPAAGIATAALFLWGMGLWPAVVIGSFLDNWLSGNGAYVSLVAATCGGAATILAVWLLRRSRLEPALDRIPHVLKLFWVALASPTPTALVGTAAIVLGRGGVPMDDYLLGVLVWWLGDAIGIILVAPVVLTWLGRPDAYSPSCGPWELAAIQVTALLSALFVFAPHPEWMEDIVGRPPLIFLIVPPLIWAAMRSGPKGTALALLLVACAAVLRSAFGQGPFANGPLVPRLVVLDMFLLATSLTMLLLAAAVSVSRRLILDLRTASREKANFVAAIRHDLAHPLQAAGLFITILRRRPMPATTRRLLGRVETALGAMEGTLANLREVTALDAGGRAVERQKVRLAEITDQLAAEYELLAHSRGLEFRYVPSQAMVETDPQLLARILRNLLTNALRYTGEGCILLGCRRSGSDILVQVRDSGPGIPPEAQSRLFEAFQRGHVDIPGEGLGLAIVRNLALALGHRIELSSSPGQGTIFSVRLPKA